VGGTYVTHGRGEESVPRFWWESPNERDHSEDRSVDGRMGSSEWLVGRSAGVCKGDPVGAG
jgi:hypothetical protein